MNAGKTIEFFTKKAEEIKPEEKPVSAPKADQTVETKTDDTQKVETDKPNNDGKSVESVEAEARPEEKKATEKAAAVTAKDVANMLASLAKNPTNTGVAAGAGLGSILAALGSISRSNDPKKKKSIATNPALLGAIGTGVGYMGGNYLESIKPQDIQEAKERVLQTVNKGLAATNAKAKDVLNLSGLKSIPSETAGDLKQTAKETWNLGKNVLKSDLGAVGIGGLGLSTLGKSLAKMDRLVHARVPEELTAAKELAEKNFQALAKGIPATTTMEELRSTNPELFGKISKVKANLATINKQIEEAGTKLLGKRIGIRERLAALDPWRYEGKRLLSQLGHATGMNGELRNSRFYENLLRRISSAQNKIQSGIRTGIKAEDLINLNKMHALSVSKRMKALNIGSKAMQILGRAVNPHRGLKGKAALIALLGSLGYGYKRMKGNGEAK